MNKFKIIKKDGKLVEFESDVQAGTYIRKLISDLGEKIGGAHMIELRRIRAGMFLEKNSFTLEDIQVAVKYSKEGKEDKLREMLIPAEIIKQVVTSLQVKEESVKGLLNGKPLMILDIVGSLSHDNENSNFAVFFKERFIGIYKNQGSELKNSENCKIADESYNKDIIGKAEFVLN